MYLIMKSMNAMKRFFTISAVAAVLVLTSLTGCEDLLETKVYTQLTSENFFESEEDFNSALITLYATMRLDWGNTDPGADTWYSSFDTPDPSGYRLMSSLCTDEMSSQLQSALVNFTFGPATWTGSANTVYSKLRYVSRATDIIDKISSAEAVSDEVRAQYTAEAKALRAWIMYYIYDFFGPVSAKLDPETLADNTIIARLSDEVYVGQMETDLLEAIPDLPAAYNDDTDNWGRVSAGTARMVLLKVYMHTQQWAKAEGIAQDIIDMGYYALQDDYADVFNVKYNSEIIYAVPTNSAVVNYYPTEVYPGDTRDYAGWYSYWMPWDFYDAYDANDARLSTILDSYVNTSSETIGRNEGLTGAIPLKYTDLDGNLSGSGYLLDVVIFRYADVLLSMAEAINEQDGPSNAYTYINAVRERANLADLSGLTQDELRDAILAERGFELYAEGFRRQDLVRHGSLIENALARGKSNAKDYMTLMPIPSTVIIEADGIIEQNPGYSN